MERLVRLFDLVWTRMADQGTDDLGRTEERWEGLSKEIAEEEEMLGLGALSRESSDLVPE